MIPPDSLAYSNKSHFKISWIRLIWSDHCKDIPKWPKITADNDAEFLPMESLYELTAEKENRGMVHNFLDSMMSMRSRGSTRRRLISSNHNYGSGSVMDSGLDVHYQQGKASEKHRDHCRSRETVIESSSTIYRARREIVNPYVSSSRTPQAMCSKVWSNDFETLNVSTSLL